MCKCNCATFKEHIQGIRFSTGEASEEFKRIEKAERQMSQDHSAYRRMVKQGLNPGKLTGAADVEKHAQSLYEVEQGKVLRDEEQTSRKLAELIVDDCGLTPPKAVVA